MVEPPEQDAGEMGTSLVVHTDMAGSYRDGQIAALAGVRLHVRGSLLDRHEDVAYMVQADNTVYILLVS